MFSKSCWVALAIALCAVVSSSSVVQAAPAADSTTPTWASSAIIRDKDGNIIGTEVTTGTGKPSDSAPKNATDGTKAPTWGISTIFRDKNGNIIGTAATYGTGKPSTSPPKNSTATGADKTPKWATSTIIRDKDGNIIGTEVSSGTGKPTAAKDTPSKKVKACV